MEILLDEVSYQDLFKMTDTARKERAKKISSRSTGIKSVMDGSAESTNEAWIFNYKTRNPHSTTNRRYHGKIIFLKQNIDNNDSVEDLDCKIHCDCPDYFYRRQYSNYNIGAGLMDPNILGDMHNNNPPVPGTNTDIGPGLCKHLVALSEYLNTKIEPIAPNPDDNIKDKNKDKQISKPIDTKQKPQQKTIQAPKPEKSSYSDSRSDDGLDSDYSDNRGLSENNNSSIWKFMDDLVAKHKKFEISYEN